MTRSTGDMSGSIRARANRAIRLNGLIRRVRIAQSTRQARATRAPTASRTIFTPLTTASKPAAKFTRENWPSLVSAASRDAGGLRPSVVQPRQSLVDSLHAKSDRETRQGAQARSKKERA